MTVVVFVVVVVVVVEVVVVVVVVVSPSPVTMMGLWSGVGFVMPDPMVFLRSCDYDLSFAPEMCSAHQGRLILQCRLYNAKSQSFDLLFRRRQK